MRKRHVIIVGGGASGLVAAITAAREGANVTLIEQKDRVGKKILSTGNGRCNLTNSYMKTECFRGDDVSIVPKVLKQFGYEDTIRFFEELGVILKDRQGYVYPISDQASTILDVLRMEIERLQVQVLLEHKVESIKCTKKGFMVQTNQKTLSGDALILATGGKASAVLGSDGSGYGLAKSFGHHMSPVVPALVQLKCKGNYFKQISGVRTNAKVSVFVEDQFVASDTGELQLTNYGISGIPVFQISRFAAKAIYAKKSVWAEIDYLPTMEDKELKKFFEQRLKVHGDKNVEDFFIGVFHKKLITMFLKEAKISLQCRAMDLRADEWNRLYDLFKHFKVQIEEPNGFDQAQICAGGMKTDEISPDTMESNYVEDLFLTGELLDIDGICGGYNLQWAWSTGYIAGKYAAKGK